MSKHTPGPWSIQDTAAYGLHIYGKGGAFGGGVLVATCRGLTERRADEQEANARLIAAAPEMLKALVAISERKNASMIGNPWQEIERLYALAEAVIAEATGGE